MSAPARKRRVSTPRERTCRACGCTDLHACEGGCWWIGADLCSRCGPPTQGPGNKSPSERGAITPTDRRN